MTSSTTIDFYKTQHGSIDFTFMRLATTFNMLILLKSQRTGICTYKHQDETWEEYITKSPKEKTKVNGFGWKVTKKFVQLKLV